MFKLCLHSKFQTADHLCFPRVPVEDLPQFTARSRFESAGKQRDNNANEIQKHLQLYDLSLGEYLVNKYALWLDFGTIDENELHGMGRRIENVSEGITLQIEKKEESAGALNAYIYLIMDVQLNIQNGAYVSAVY